MIVNKLFVNKVQEEGEVSSSSSSAVASLGRALLTLDF